MVLIRRHSKVFKKNSSSKLFYFLFNKIDYYWTYRVHKYILGLVGIIIEPTRRCKSGVMKAQTS